MKPKHTPLLLLLCTLSNCKTSEAGFLNFVSDVAYKSVCLFKQECCDNSNIPGDVTKLKEQLQLNVFGQHIAIEMVVNAIAGHWESPHARKPLTMSFHGWTGSGKNYISQIIAESLYKKGMKSSHVHLFNAGIDFPEFGKVKQYKENLYNAIKSNVSACPKQLIIFDDVHSMPAGVLDGIKTILDYHENVQNVDYRQCIFIFLSNTGALSITNHFMGLWRSGRKRDDIVLGDFETMISQGAFNEEGEEGIARLPFIGGLLKRATYFLGGFFRSETIKNNLIDHYIPFLPLEREHVELCIDLEFKLRGIRAIDAKTFDEVINFIEWGPSPENKFAKTGCKRLSQKVASIASKLRRNGEL